LSVWAVLAAAGRGERLEAERPKAFAQLRGRPLLAESLGRLEASGWIESIVVVAPPGWEEPVILLAEELGCGKVVASVAGGETRADSVRIGVGEVAADAAVIVVHDAARPLVSDELVERVVTPLSQGWDGAVPGLAVVDTVKRVGPDGAIVETVPRGDLVVVQTPQAFVADVLRRALASETASAATDCASLVEAQGGRIQVVDGDPRLLKVTSPEDLALVEIWLAA